MIKRGMSLDMDRENRYIVYKIKNLDPAERVIVDRVFTCPREECVVVASDWPIYEEVWEQVERLVEKRPSLKEEINTLKTKILNAAIKEQELEERIEDLKKTNKLLEKLLDIYQGKPHNVS